MSEDRIYPFEIRDVNSEETALLNKHFDKGVVDKGVRVGPKGYFLPHGFAKEASHIYNLKLRPDDIWVITYPKAGTTWAQELVWMVANDCDYEKSESLPLAARFPFLEMKMFFTETKGQAYLKKLGASDDDRQVALTEELTRADTVSSQPSPRFIKSHLPLSLLPPALLHTCKVVHVARDPRDVAVSYYNHHKLFNMLNFEGSFKEFWNMFINDQLIWSPFFENVKESWDKRNHPNMLFLFYEELAKDLPSVVRRVADFLGKTIPEDEMGRLCEHLSFDSFKNNKTVNAEVLKDLDFSVRKYTFMRKGKAGGWRDDFDEEMTQQAARWMEDQLRDTDLRFPEVN